jgi:hypothetical protein
MSLRTRGTSPKMKRAPVPMATPKLPRRVPLEEVSAYIARVGGLGVGFAMGCRGDSRLDGGAQGVTTEARGDGVPANWEWLV